MGEEGGRERRKDEVKGETRRYGREEEEEYEEADEKFKKGK